MRPFLFRIFDEFNEQVSIFEKPFNDDLCAYEYARRLARQDTIEIWDAGYLVAHLKPGDVPAAPRDASGEAAAQADRWGTAGPNRGETPLRPRAPKRGSPVEPPDEWRDQAKRLKSLRKLRWTGYAAEFECLRQAETPNAGNEADYLHELAEGLQSLGTYLGLVRRAGGGSPPDCAAKREAIEKTMVELIRSRKAFRGLRDHLLRRQGWTFTVPGDDKRKAAAAVPYRSSRRESSEGETKSMVPEGRAVPGSSKIRSKPPASEGVCHDSTRA